MNKNKNIKLIMLLIIALIFLNQKVYAASPVKSYNRSFAGKNAKIVQVNLKDPSVKLNAITGQNLIGKVESFGSMIKRNNSLAAINTNFFDAYNTMRPYGSIMVDGNILYLEGSESYLVADGKGQVTIGDHTITINGYLNGRRENSWNNETNSMDFNTFSAWYVNSPAIDQSGVYLYTNINNTVTLNGGTAIVVHNDRVTNIIKNAKKVTVPKTGYLIYYGNSPTYTNYIDQRFKIGQEVKMEVPVTNNLKKYIKNPETNKKELKDVEEIIENPKTIISAEPYLVRDGQYIFNPNNTNVREKKIISGRGQRSAVGISKNNQLFLVTAGNMNMKELGNAMIQLGCQNAMNLDGGASSALYANGKTLTSPGRNLHTILSIEKKLN